MTSLYLFFNFSFVFPTENVIRRNNFLLGMTAGLLHCHIEMVSYLGLLGYNNWVSLFLFVFSAGRLWNPWCRHLAGCHPRELCHPLLFFPIPVSCQPADRHRDVCHDHWLRGLHRCHQRKQVPPAECEYWAAAVFAVLWCWCYCNACCRDLHLSRSCPLNTDETEPCGKQALIIMRSCRSFLTMLSMEDETHREGIVSGGGGFLELFGEEEEFCEDIFCSVSLNSFSLRFDSNPL